MTRNVAMDCGKRGIRVNSVCPGPILTTATAKHAASQGKTLVSNGGMGSGSGSGVGSWGVLRIAPVVPTRIRILSMRP